MAAHRRRRAGQRRACEADGRRRLPAAVPRGGCAMTATGGGPAVRGAGPAAPARAGDQSRVTARSRAPRLRAVLGLAGVEASVLVRSVLVLAGLLAGGAVVWVRLGPVEPL